MLLAKQLSSLMTVELSSEEIESVITSTKVKDYVYTIKNSTLKNKIVR